MSERRQGARADILEAARLEAFAMRVTARMIARDIAALVYTGTGGAGAFAPDGTGSCLH